MTYSAINLHLHSSFSDGEVEPGELAAECKKVGLEIVALTDHECIDGLDEFINACEELKLHAVTGAEISTTYNNTEQHILALNINPKDSGLLDLLMKCNNANLQRIQAIIYKLTSLGLLVDLPSVQQYARGVVCIRHLSHAVLQNPRNKTPLQKLGITHTRTLRALFSPGGLAFVKRDYLPQIKDTIRIINASGGTAIWAHPFWNEQTTQFIEESARDLKAMGLGGLEVFYPRHDEKRTKKLHHIAEKLDILETAGSDFHSFNFERLSKLMLDIGFGIQANLPIFCKIH